MTKFLIVIGVLALLIGLIYARYRRQIKAAREIYRTFKDFQKAARSSKENRFENDSAETKSRLSEGDAKKLVRCVSCGEWVSETRSIRFGQTNQVFCSTKCLERMEVKS